MKKQISRELLVFVSVLVFTFISSQVFAVDKDNNPPGPKGGPGTNWENKPGPQGGPGASPDISKEEKAKVNEPWEIAADLNHDGVIDQTEIQRWRQLYPNSNPAGTQGGQAADQNALQERAQQVNEAWEKAADLNHDGIIDQTEIQLWRQSHSGNGGQGTSQNNVQENAQVNRPWEKEADTNQDRVVDQTEIQQWRQAHPDNDNNPPGPKGGPGTNWENKPGPQGGPGASPNIKHDNDNNPPGPKGGPGTNWENKPGPQGGPGASPNRIRRAVNN